MKIETAYKLGDMVWSVNNYGYPCQGRINKIIFTEHGVAYNFGYGDKYEKEVFDSLDDLNFHLKSLDE